ncbi:MAG: hypothetical protein KJ747_02640 [Actinobacteria bacterium]|nr:hypothetical protein [Actinomycetota bacterium]
MSTLAIIIYVAFGAGYLAMILQTERSADRYVRGQVSTRPRTSIVVIPAPIPKPERQRVSAPQAVRTSS